MRRLLSLTVLLGACVDGKGSDSGTTDNDGDGFGPAEDCNDDDAAINPAADELCDGLDNNCNGDTDEAGAADEPAWYPDGDGDGFGAVDGAAVLSCAQPSGHVENAEDCDDAVSAIYPGADELCDTVDNDCDGDVDEGDAVDAATWYADSDGDGEGDLGSPMSACAQPSGYTDNTLDCDDTSDTINTLADELCDTVDNDCDGTVDEDDAVDAVTWYADSDGDGFGDEDMPWISCAPPSGYVADGTDCNDDNAEIFDSCFPTFDGTTGKTWTKMASNTHYLSATMAYHPEDIDYIYNTSTSPGQYYDPATNTWNAMTASAPYASFWASTAPWDGDLWMMRNDNVYTYDPDTNAWSTVTSITCGDDYNATESDEYGVIYGHDPGYLVTYDTVTGTADYISTGMGSLYETRMAYDPVSRAIFFGAFYLGDLYKYDLATGSLTAMSDHPESFLNDIFCSDRSGHIYAAGGSSGKTMWQYDVATDTWSSIPDLPVDHGNNWTCTVSHEGYLYVGAGSSGSDFYRIELY